MKNVLCVGLLCFLSLSLADGQKASKRSNAGDQIKKQEENWALAVVKKGVAPLDRYEADDIITTAPSGRVTNKAQDKTDLSSGDYKIQSEELSDLRVHIYGEWQVLASQYTKVIEVWPGNQTGRDRSRKASRREERS